MVWVGDVGGSIYQTSIVLDDDSSSVARDGVQESIMLTHHTRQVCALEQSLDGTRLVSSSMDGLCASLLYLLTIPLSRICRALGHKDGTGVERAV